MNVVRKHILAYASEDAAALYAILCTSSGALHESTGESKHAISSLYFKGKAIHHLQQTILNANSVPPSLATAYAVSLLLWIEVSKVLSASSD